ncbi:MAG: DNA repair protein RadC [Bacteroidales bacterium]|nr:DNA repair protein RadC [Bacteroidales bacterium]
MRERLKIQEWDSTERPREKFIEKGAESLSNAELLAILLRSGSREENAIELARRLLYEAGNSLSALKKYTLEDYNKLKGIWPGKALSIMAAFEINKRIESEEQPEASQIYSSRSAAAIMSPILKDLQHEECWVIYLNTANKVIAKERVSSGGINCTVVDIKMIIKRAISKLASSIILFHNHPSGSLYPGEQDKVQTRKLQNAAQICDLNLTDHIIIGGKGYYSFLDEGLL